MRCCSGVPPRGDAAWNAYNRNFNDRHYPPPEVALADVQVIMAPKHPAQLFAARGQEKNYSDYVRKNFSLAGESTYWRAYRRAKARGPELTRRRRRA